MQKTYDWQRYWYKDENSPLIINGFLNVHEYTKGVFTLDSVLDVPCLVLRGESGMGKSREIEKIYEAQIEDENNKKLYFPLSSYGDENRLVKDIFDSGKIKQWKEGSSNLYLFLDSLDEALLNINTLALLLADEIGKLPKERLFLRIACRTAEWSNLSVLENKLKEIWKEDNCQILQIAPLQQKDVEIATQTENLDSEKFLDEISNKNVSVLASKPVTLQFLLKIFDGNKTLPSTQTELYKKGCLTLCEEKNERRKASKRIGKLTPEQRFVISARIAALMIFGNKSSIWIGGITGEEENSDILISELSGYSEKRKDNSEFQITEEDVREAIFDTGLFTGNSNNRLKFSHQTFAEFLAAWYLEYRELSDDSVTKLIGEKYLYPQLYETSAWIANQRPSVFQYLMKVAPAILLRSDILLADESSKVKLVDILLELFDKEKIQGIDRNYYRKLNQPKLAEQIRPYIIDKTKGWLVRSEALDMVEVCKVKELQEDLSNIALDKKDNQDIRVYAALAVSRVGDSETKAKLKPLVFGKEDDERFRLKGVALDALWNEHLTAKELFSVLTPANSHSMGSYEAFLGLGMITKLETKYLPIALDWLIENITQFGHSDFSERRLSDEILFKAWENLEDEEIFERFVKIVIKQLSNHSGIFKEIRNEEKLGEIFKDNNKRRKVWLKLFSIIKDENYWVLEDSKFFGLGNEDINWLVQEWENTKDEMLKVKLLSRLKDFISYRGTHPVALDEICKACDENEVLKKEFEEIFAPIELGSEKAEQLKQSYEETFSWEKRHEKEREERDKPISPSPTERTLEWIEKAEKDFISGFWQINWWLMFLPNGTSNKSELEFDLTQFPVWDKLGENAKLKIIEAAKNTSKKVIPKMTNGSGQTQFIVPRLQVTEQ